MEWALSVCNANQLGRWIEQGSLEEFRPAAEDGFPPDVDFKRIYFGQEFCERALPKVDEVMQAVMFCNKAKKKFTLVTPYVTEYGLDAIKDILLNLEKYSANCEVVANDWGVLYLLQEKHASLVPVLGRLLNKTWRDPRMDYYIKDIPTADRRLFKTCSLAGPFMRRLMSSFGVNRIEMDNLLQGLDECMPEWGYRVSLYLPYGCVTTGRICFFQSWGLKSEDKFRASPRACGRQCEGQWLEFRENLFSSPANPKCEVLQKGNSVFYRQSPALVQKGLEQAGYLGIDRVVYQPEPL